MHDPQVIHTSKLILLQANTIIGVFASYKLPYYDYGIIII